MSDHHRHHYDYVVRELSYGEHEPHIDLLAVTDAITSHSHPTPTVESPATGEPDTSPAPVGVGSVLDGKEGLDALPEGTVIAWRGIKSEVEYSIRSAQHGVRPGYQVWDFISVGTETGKGSRYTSDALLYYAVPESIRVVSVPIDALLADETVLAAEDAFVNVTHLSGPVRDEAETVIRAAVAHVTGETL